jgi:hypothetical protein
MSKKLIAIASAAALALTAFVALPVQAATTIGDGTDSAKTGASATEAITLNVPADNSIDAENNDYVKFDVVSSSGKTVSATSTGGVKLLAATTNSGELWDSKAGTQSFSAVSAGANIVFYAFTTSTTAATVVVNDGIGNVQTFYIKGLAGEPYNIDVTAPTFVGAKADARVLVKVTDVFGNAIGGTSKSVVRAGSAVKSTGTGATAPQLLDGANSLSSGFTISATVVGGDATVSDVDGSGDPVLSNTTSDHFEWDDKSKAYVAFLVGRSTDGQIALSTQLLDAGNAITEVDGLALPKATSFSVLNSGDQSVAIAALQKQVADLQVIVDRKVSKKRYNTLARKWNRAFPSQAVKLKK